MIGARIDVAADFVNVVGLYGNGSFDIGRVLLSTDAATRSRRPTAPGSR
jgi:hypothetical protein